MICLGLIPHGLLSFQSFGSQRPLDHVREMSHEHPTKFVDQSDHKSTLGICPNLLSEVREFFVHIFHIGTPTSQVRVR